MQAAIGVAIALLAASGLNWTYQVVRKPSELLFPVSGALNRTPEETWQVYAPLFRRHATHVISADLLAAIAQVEGSGNPLARTYWRWSWSSRPFEVYRPASSAVGMYQMTDGTFAEARHYCIHDHRVVQDGPWNSWHSCWFNALYTRLVPTHAVELTAAYLDLSVTAIVGRHGGAPLGRQQTLAELIHLCGAGAGEAYARRGYRLLDGQSCGDHAVRDYLGRVETMRALFLRLAQRSDLLSVNRP